MISRYEIFLVALRDFSWAKATLLERFCRTAIWPLLIALLKKIPSPEKGWRDKGSATDKPVASGSGCAIETISRPGGPWKRARSC